MSWYPTKDADGDAILKSKVTKPGWTFDQRGIEWKTATLSSVISKKKDLSDWGDVSIMFFKDDGGLTQMVSPTQAELDTDCVRTCMLWEPLYDYDLLGGEIEIIEDPTGYENNRNASLWIVAVPDLTEAQGGSIEMVGGRILPPSIEHNGRVLKADGKGVKTLYYDAVYHTNKMDVTIDHAAGEKFRLEIVYEHYFAR